MKKLNILYWVFTVLFGGFMVSTAIPNILMDEGSVALISTQLGYPKYMIPFLGVAKTLGGIMLFIPGFPRLKEWAYAGCFFLTSGAIFSYISSEDGIVKMLPAVLLLALTVVSWYLRPESRRISTKEIVVS